MINVREVRIEDTVKLIELLVELTKEKPPVALELSPLIMKGERWVEPFLDQKAGFFVVAEMNGNIVGFCYVAIPKWYKPVTYIAIAVSKDYRRKDVGAQLLFHVAEWASKKHLEYMIADVWDWNEGSLNFFKKHGFKEKLKFQDKFKGKQEKKVRLVMKL
jgi:N-acetylglutamate synthase-like GNAT family acetyltransferase